MNQRDTWMKRGEHRILAAIVFAVVLASAGVAAMLLGEVMSQKEACQRHE